MHQFPPPNARANASCSCSCSCSLLVRVLAARTRARCSYACSLLVRVLVVVLAARARARCSCSCSCSLFVLVASPRRHERQAERREPRGATNLILGLIASQLVSPRAASDARRSVRGTSLARRRSGSDETLSRRRLTGRHEDSEPRGRGLASVPTWTLVASRKTLSRFARKFEPPSHPASLFRTGTGVLAGCGTRTESGPRHVAAAFIVTRARVRGGQPWMSSASRAALLLPKVSRQSLESAPFAERGWSSKVRSSFPNET